MSPVLTLEKKTRIYTKEIRTLENSVVKDDLTKVSLGVMPKIFEACYDSFNDVQMELQKLKKVDLEDYQKKQEYIYRVTYKFLSFLENDIDADLFIVLLKIESVAKLIKHYKKYCSRTENEFKITVDGETYWKDNDQVKKIIARYAKK